jgi:DNA polymerase-3 subunit delta'
MEILDVYKNSNVYDIIEKDIKNGMVSHAYLLRSDDYELIVEYSKCIAKQLLCEDNICDICANCMRVNHNTHTDVLVYPKEDAKQLLTNDILEIISSSYVSGGEKYKVFILNNFEKTNTQAQNKFLKTLEEPPKNVVFIILTTDIKSVLKTIVSRCKQINVRNLTQNDLIQVANTMNIKAGVSANDLAKSARNLTTLIKLVDSPYYLNLRHDVVSVFTKMKHSRSMLNYIHALTKYKDGLEVLSELNTVVLDLLYLKNNNSNISNSIYISDLQEASSEFSIQALNLIALKIKEAITKVNSNCNINLVYDNLLMYILEVKTKC